MTLALRDGVARDAEAIAHVHLTALRAALPHLARPHADAEAPAYFATVLADARVRVAEYEGAVAGFIASSGSRVAHLYVTPAFQRAGIGRALLADARAADVRRLTLYTFAANAGARRFYEREGFRAIEFSDGSGNEEREPDVLYEWVAPGTLTVVPAIDVRGGRCVRLLHGDPARETRYDDDPVARARAFAAAGARRLHVVDLDGAFGTGENLAALGAVCRAVDVPVQSGGGIRTSADLNARFAAGAAFAIVQTMLVEAPHEARAALREHGARIIGGVDARGDVVAYRGWQVETGKRRDDFVRELASAGFARIVFTEIARDGAGTGYDVDALAHVATLAPLAVTASGGARTLDDLRALVDATPPNCDAAIVGRALYDGTLDLGEALTTFA